MYCKHQILLVIPCGCWWVSLRVAHASALGHSFAQHHMEVISMYLVQYSIIISLMVVGSGGSRKIRFLHCINLNLRQALCCGCKCYSFLPVLGKGCISVLPPDVEIFFLLPSTLYLAVSPHLWNYRFSLSPSLSRCVPLHSLLPASPGVHQATAGGGTEAARDLTAATTAWTSATSGNGNAKPTGLLCVHLVCVCVCACVVSSNVPVRKWGSTQPHRPGKSSRT